MKQWLKWIALGVAALVVLVVGLAVVATRPAFIKAVVLPRVGRSLQTDIRVERLAFTPWSRLQAEGVRVGPADVPLVDSRLLRLRYRLFSALRGQVRVDEVRLADTTIHLLRREDGSTNLPVVPPSQPRPAREPSRDEPQDVRLADLHLENVSLVYEQRPGPAQEAILIRLTGLALDVPEIGSGREGAFTVAGRLDALEVAGLTAVQGTLQGEGRVGLDAALGLERLDLTARLTLSGGNANAVSLAGREARLELEIVADAQGIALRRLGLTLLKDAQPEAVLSVTGEIRRDPAEVRLEVTADPLEAALFDIVGAFMGDVSFGTPRGSYRGQVVATSPHPLRRTLERSLELPWQVAANGRLELLELSPTSPSWGLQGVAPFAVHADHDVAWDRQARTVEIRAVRVRAGSAGQDHLEVTLSEPMRLDLSGATPLAAQTDAALAVRARGLGLAALNPFLPATVPFRAVGGSLDADARVEVGPQGDAVGLNATVSITDAVLAAADQRGQGFAVSAQLAATLANPRRLTWREAQVVVRPARGEPLTLTASGTLDLQEGGRGTFAFAGLRDTTLAILPEPGLARLPVSGFAGSGDLEWRLGKDFRPVSLDGRIALAQGRWRDRPEAPELAVATAFRTELTAAALTVHASDLVLRLGDDPAARFAATGSIGLDPAGGPPATLAVTSDLLDLDRLLAVLQPPNPATGVAPAGPAVSAPVLGAGPVTSPALPALQQTVNWDFQRLIYRQHRMVATGHATLADGAALTTLNLTLPAGTISASGSVRPAGPDWQARLELTAAGEALTELASWFGQAVPPEPLQGSTLALRGAGTLAPDGARAGAESLDVTLARANQAPILSATLSKPITLTRTAAGALAWTDADLSVTATGFPLAMANPWLPASAGLRLNTGSLNTTLKVALKAEGPRADLDGRFAVVDLTGRYGEQAFSDLGLEGVLQAQAVGRTQITLSRLEATATVAGHQALVVSSRGNWDAAKGGDVGLRGRLDVPIALRAAGLSGPSVERLRVLTLTLDGKAHLAPERGPVRAEAILGAADIGLTDAAGKALPPWSFDLTTAATVHPERVVVESLALRARTPEQPLAHLDLTGTVALPPLQGQSDLALRGERLDLDRLLAVTRGQPAASTGQATPQGPGPAPAEPGPIDTGAAVVRANLDLRGIRYGEVLTDLACTARLENSVLIVDPLKTTVNGTVANGRARIRLGVPGFEYEVALALANLDLLPFVKTFAPDLATSVQGSLSSLDVELAGQGVTRPALQRHLQGRVSLGAQNLVIQGLSGLAAVAQKWAAPELNRLQITQAELRTQVGDGAATVELLKAVAPEFLLQGTGRVGFDESLALSLTLGVGGALQARLQNLAVVREVVGTFVKQGDHLVSPRPIPIGGTLRSPKADYQQYLLQAGASRLTEALQGMLGTPNATGNTPAAAPGLTIPGTGLTLPVPTGPAIPAAPATAPTTATVPTTPPPATAPVPATPSPVPAPAREVPQPASPAVTAPAPLPLRDRPFPRRLQADPPVAEPTGPAGGQPESPRPRRLRLPAEEPSPSPAPRGGLLLPAPATTPAAAPAPTLDPATAAPPSATPAAGGAPAVPQNGITPPATVTPGRAVPRRVRPLNRVPGKDPAAPAETKPEPAPQPAAP